MAASHDRKDALNVLDNVERIAAPPAEIFHHDYVLKRRPVILTNLFDAHPIRALDTAAKFRERLPDLPVAVQPNYMTALLTQGRIGELQQTTLGEFLDRLERDPETQDYCVEYPTPPAMGELIAPTEHCRRGDESDLLSLMFVAARGNFAQLHYDGDQRHVLMYQAFGRKRYVLIDAAEGGKVAPLAERNIQRTSAILLQNFSEADKRAFLEYTCAWDCVLQPGETLFMPMMIWHYIEYLDVSMSISYRLGRNAYNRSIADAVPIPSVFLQRLAIQFADETAVDAERREVFRRLQQASAVPYSSETARAQALDRFCMEACDRLDPAGSVLYTTLDRERREQLVRETPTEPEPSRSVTRDRGPPAWLDGDSVTLAPDVMVVRPLSDEGAASQSVLLVRNGQLESKLTLDDETQWLLGALKLLSSELRTPSVSELSARCGADTVWMRQTLSQLYARGWVVSPAPS